MNKETQKQRILRLFAENGNILTLAQLMDKKHGLGSEYRARISELRKKYEILCTENKEDPNNNLYTFYGELAEKTPDKSEFIEIKNRHVYGIVQVKEPCSVCGSYYRRDGICNICG